LINEGQESSGVIHPSINRFMFVYFKNIYFSFWVLLIALQIIFT
jgi:hypothetical protein